MYVVSYLLQLLDDGHRQLTDIFTVWTSCLLLLSFSVGGGLNYPFWSTCVTLWFCSTIRGQSGKCVASYRAGNRRETDESGPRRRPWQTLKSPPPNNRSQEGRRIGAAFGSCALHFERLYAVAVIIRLAVKPTRRQIDINISLTVQSITGGGNPPGNPFCSTRHFFSAHIFLFFFFFGFRAVAPFSLLSNGAIFNTFSLLIKCDGCIMERDVTFFFAVISSGSLEIWNILKKLSWIRWWKASLQM